MTATPAAPQTPGPEETHLRRALQTAVHKFQAHLDEYPPLPYGPTSDDLLDEASTVLGRLITAMREIVETNAALRQLAIDGATTHEGALICGATDTTVAFLESAIAELAAGLDSRAIA